MKACQSELKRRSVAQSRPVNDIALQDGRQRGHEMVLHEVEEAVVVRAEEADPFVGIRGVAEVAPEAAKKLGSRVCNLTRRLQKPQKSMSLFCCPAN
jgi:hypothetical protein